MSNVELGPLEDEPNDEIAKDQGVESEDIQKDIRERAQGNPGATNVLNQLASRGAEVYNAVAPNLGPGYEIWLKYRDECKEDLDAMIEKYGGKQ